MYVVKQHILLTLILVGVFMSNDLFKVCGVSRANGSVKVRFANDLSRVKVLVRGGHTDIELRELPEPANKADCVKFLMQSDLYSIAEFKEAIDRADSKYSAVSVVKVSGARVAKTAPNLDEIRARALLAEADLA
jgi:hypothetical protein